MGRRGGHENGGAASGSGAATVMADAIGQVLYTNIPRLTGIVNRMGRMYSGNAELFAFAGGADRRHAVGQDT